jgi:hypothetical protein
MEKGVPVTFSTHQQYISHSNNSNSNSNINININTPGLERPSPRSSLTPPACCLFPKTHTATSTKSNKQTTSKYSLTALSLEINGIGIGLLLQSFLLPSFFSSNHFWKWRYSLHTAIRCSLLVPVYCT